MKYFTSILSAFICGLIASLPWLLVYVYGGYIMSILAIPIALAADWGYRKSGGPVNTKMGLIIGLVTLIIVALQAFVIIPLFLLNDYGMTVSLSALSTLYSNSSFVSAIMQDALVSLIFAGIGVAGVIGNNAKNRYDSGASGWSINKRRKTLVEEQNTNAIKDVFLDYEAYDEDSAIEKEKFNELFELDFKVIPTFNSLKRKGIIKEINDKYYMLKEDEQDRS